MMRSMLAVAALLLAAAPKPAAAQTGEAELAAMIGGYAREHDFNGTILVQDSGGTRYHGAFGVAERAFGVPADTTARYRVASITKLFTAVLVMQLHQEGRLHVDSAIARYLPGYPGEGADRVTLHQLLNHTSGIEPFDREQSFQEGVENGLERYQRPHTTDALLARCCSGKLAGEPLGLRETGMLRQDTVMSRLAPTYFYPDDTGRPINDLPVYVQNFYAAGAMYSTAPDLLIFADALFGGDRLLGAEARARLLAPGQDDYGYGLWSYSFTRNGTRHRVAKRPGSIMGANAVLYRLLDRGATIILLANTNRTDLDEFAQRIADHLVR
jgi:D-alanyl-D-alanine carboxypeptidase